MYKLCTLREILKYYFVEAAKMKWNYNVQFVILNKNLINKNRTKLLNLLQSSLIIIKICKNK